MVKRLYIVPVLVIAALGTAVLAFRADELAVPTPGRFTNGSVDKAVLLPLSANALSALIPVNPFGLDEPVAQFTDRITKKNFGLYVTPENSPVEHDHFTGFHTGVDAEFTDTTADIPVFAIADGTVVLSTWAHGYGGVLVIKTSINNVPVYALYGHLNEASLVKNGAHVTKGQQLGILGADHSEETDNVRKHLHFSIYTGQKLDIRGYVPEKDDLVNWVDPLTFF